MFKSCVSGVTLLPGNGHHAASIHQPPRKILVLMDDLNAHIGILADSHTDDSAACHLSCMPIQLSLLPQQKRCSQATRATVWGRILASKHMRGGGVDHPNGQGHAGRPSTAFASAEGQHQTIPRAGRTGSATAAGGTCTPAGCRMLFAISGHTDRPLCTVLQTSGHRNNVPAWVWSDSCAASCLTAVEHVVHSLHMDHA